MLIGIIWVCRCTTSISLACQAYHRWLMGQKIRLTHIVDAITQQPPGQSTPNLVYLNRPDPWMCNVILNCSPMGKKKRLWYLHMPKSATSKPIHSKSNLLESSWPIDVQHHGHFIRGSQWAKQATGLDAWASRVKCPTRFVSHLHDICIYMSCL